jgi:dipeptidase E
VFIPVAQGEEDSSSSVAWFMSMLRLHGKEDLEVVVANTPTELLALDLSRHTAVYIAGGNTYLLLSTLRDVGLGQRLHDFWKRGGILYGGSAGAIVLGRDIATVSEEKTPTFTGPTAAFDFLGGISLRCHFSEADLAHLEYLSLSLGHPVLGLPEETGLHLEGDVVRVLGTESATLWGSASRGVSLQPGSLHPLLSLR